MVPRLDMGNETRLGGSDSDWRQGVFLEDGEGFAYRQVGIFNPKETHSQKG